ncbi:MAG: transporter [Planctomycetales bacterium]
MTLRKTAVSLAVMLVLWSGVSGTAVAGDPCDLCASGCGNKRPKRLLTWAGQKPTYVSDYDEEDTLNTDRPDFTESSATVGLGRVQLEAGYTYVYDEDGTNYTKENSFGEPLFRIGMFAEWFELRIAWNYLEEDTLTGGVFNTDTGAVDMYLGAKLGLTEQHGVLPETSLIPQMRVPTGANAFSADEVLPGLNFIYAWQLTDRLSMAGSTQANRTVDDLGQYYTEVAQSWVFGLSLTDKLGTYAEWFGIFPDGALDPSVGAQHSFNGGFAYLVNNNLQLDARAGLGLNARAPDYFLGTGFSIRF